jgi:hypothetical protein
MAKSPKQQQEPEDEAVIMVRMKQRLKRLLSTPSETHEEMVRRRRGEKKPTQAKELGSNNQSDATIVCTGK